MNYKMEIVVSIIQNHPNHPIAAYVRAEYIASILEEETVVAMLPMRRRDFDSIKTSARHTARRTKEPVVVVEMRLAEQYEKAMVDEAYATVAIAKVNEWRMNELYGSPWD